MGKLIRAMDWSKTPLGPIETWPQSLRTTVSLCLASNFPISIAWGPQRTQIYNDGYWPICGAKHPRSMGQDFKECWFSAWPAIGEAFERASAGEAAFLVNQRMFLDRYGYLEETFFTFSFSPIQDESGGVGGLFHPVTEMTQQTLAERRLKILRELADNTAEAKTVASACHLIVQTFAAHDLDVPFALLYLLDADGRRATLAGGTGLSGEASPEVVELTLPPRPCWPLAEATHDRQAVLVDDIEQQFGPLGCGPYPESPQTAVVLPINLSGLEHLFGLLVVGVSSRRELDEPYRTFYVLLGEAVTNALSKARAYEEERKRAEALAELDRAKTAFFSNVSHEFRTPLTLMLGPLEELLQQAEGTLPLEQRRQLEVAHRNSMRLLKLVNSLLDFSRIEAGRIQASYEPTGLAALTAELASVFRSAVERAGLRLIVNCPPLPELVYVDQEMWEKVVLNLLSNAFKFTFEGEIEVSLRPAGAQVELVVRDTGTGIPAAELPHLFERFHRVQNARGRTFEGSGIGLALVQELVKLHGGTVRVESEIGRGSMFTVAIPLGKAHLPADRIGAARTLTPTSLQSETYVEEALRWLPDPDFELPFQEASPPILDFDLADARVEPAGLSRQPDQLQARIENRKSKILLADDNADMRDYLWRLLSQRYEVVAVNDGLAALQAAREEPFDLALVDVMMPGLDGFGLLHELRADERTATVPMIMLSARAGEEARVEGMEAGADDYLIKPFSARELLARVEAHLKLARLRREEEARIAADLQAMERLYEVGNLCARAGHDFEQCLEEILAAAITLSGADKGNIQLLDAESGILKIVAQCGFAEPFLEFFARVGDEEVSACGAALQSASRILVEDVTKSEIFAGQPSLEVLLEADVRAVQSTPLISSSGQLLGMISTHFRRPHRAGERDLRLIDLLARQVADYLERRQAEEALRHSEARFRTLSETAPALIWFNDEEGKCRFVNQQYLDFTGKKLEEIMGTGWLPLLHPEDAEAYVNDFLAAQRERRPFHHRIRVQRHDGVWCWLESYAQPLFASDGAFLGHVGVSPDITASVEAEEALRASKERLQQAISIETVGISFLTLEGLITEANEAFLRMSGFSQEALQAGELIWQAITPPEFIPQSLQALEELKTVGQSTPYEKQYLRTDGSRWWGVFAAKRLSENEAVEFILDVTPRKEAEEALRRARDELEERVQARTQALHEANSELQVEIEARQWAETQLRRMASRLTLAEQEERHRLSQMLHDDLQQLLYGIQLKIEFVRDGLQNDQQAALLGHTEEVITPGFRALLRGRARLRWTSARRCSRARG